MIGLTLKDLLCNRSELEYALERAALKLTGVRSTDKATLTRDRDDSEIERN